MSGGLQIRNTSIEYSWGKDGVCPGRRDKNAIRSRGSSVAVLGLSSRKQYQHNDNQEVNNLSKIKQSQQRNIDIPREK